jgi:membrane-bound ClpP family serine protease
MTSPGHDIERRARAAAAGLRQATTLNPPELSDLVRAARVRRGGRVALGLAAVVVLAAMGFAAGSVSDPQSLRWVTGVILVILLASTWLLCVHAGGHALFVPLPALALAVLWAVTVPGHHDSVAWWLVAMTAATAGLGAMFGSMALRQRLRGSSQPLPSLKGADGIALTPLVPNGVVQVASESWSAVSLSGRLPAGAPVHVVRVAGVRLEVWSEAGTVPDHRALENEEEPQ